MDDVIFFELNNWSSEYFPVEEPYISWVCLHKSNGYYANMRDDRWIKENGLVVACSIIDMSFNYCITAKRKWVEDNCPSLLTKHAKFIRVPDEPDEIPRGRFGCPFLEYTKENVGYHEYCEDDY